MGSVFVTQLQGPWLSPVLGLLSTQFHTFIMAVWVSSGFPSCLPTSQKKEGMVPQGVNVPVLSIQGVLPSHINK